MLAMGYAMPRKHWEAEAAPALWLEAGTPPGSAGSSGGAETPSEALAAPEVRASTPVKEELDLNREDLPLVSASPHDAVKEEPHLDRADPPFLFASPHDAEEVLPPPREMPRASLHPCSWTLEEVS